MLIDTLRKDKMAALKAKDSLTNGVVSILIANAGLKAKDLKRDLTSEEELAILQKELKQTNETLNSIPASRPEMIEETKRKIEVIEAYLPKQMSIDEIKKYVKNKIETMNANGETVLELSPKNYNRMLMSELAGKCDGKNVSIAITELASEMKENN